MIDFLLFQAPTVKMKKAGTNSRKIGLKKDPKQESRTAEEDAQMHPLLNPAVRRMTIKSIVIIYQLLFFTYQYDL